MRVSKISERYANAVFQLAKEHNIHKQVNDDMVYVDELCETVKEFNLFLKSPLINKSKKLKIAEKLFDSKVQKMTYSFIKLMINKNRESYLCSIAKYYQELFMIDMGIKKAYVQSAVPLSEDNKNELIKLLGNISDLKIDLQETINPDLIGGFVVDIDDYEINQSLENKLRTIKKELSKNLYLKDF
ncbi:MAG: ATP synthase F1 subunit delta [Lentimicrobiaceae bacterium]|nr:ATP synthase F1 subunit delta [Lentimicrobiaceae bacterium]